jgi:rhodanese-related sulfurtransferase
MTREEFIQEVTEGLLPPPAYFPLNVKMNKEGYESIDSILEKGSAGLDPETFEQTANQYNALVLDVRHQSEFVKSHIPKSIFIGLDGSFAPWVGALIKDVSRKILLVVEPGREKEAITRLARVGFDQTLGYLDGGIEAWKSAGKELDSIESISPEEFAERYGDGTSVVDVRRPGEYNTSHVENASHAPLGELNEYMEQFGDGKQYVHCAGGYRSVIAISILKSRGFHNLVNVEQGFDGIVKTQLPIIAGKESV